MSEAGAGRDKRRTDPYGTMQLPIIARSPLLRYAYVGRALRAARPRSFPAHTLVLPEVELGPAVNVEPVTVVVPEAVRLCDDCRINVRTAGWGRDVAAATIRTLEAQVVRLETEVRELRAKLGMGP